MPPKKRKREDPDVVKTERDDRRATGREDDDDFEDVAEPKINLNRVFTSAAFSRYKRAKLKQSAIDDDPFPFLRLPAEIRNMIYRYLVLSKAPGKIRLDQVKDFVAGGIEINILLCNRQTYNEAAKILYDENVCQAFWTKWDYHGVSLRVDDPKTKTTTSRSLRSGRAVDMIKYKGLIYEESLYRLRKVEYHLDVFDRCNICDHMTLFWAKRMYTTLWSLSSIISRHSRQSTKGQDSEWEVVIHSNGHGLGPKVLEKLVEPIIFSGAPKAIRDGMLKVRLEGNFPKKWKRIFAAFQGAGFITDKVEVDDDAPARDVNGIDLEWYFDEEDYMWY